MATATFEASTLPHLCDVLMAAAHADDLLDGREVEAVKKLLGGLLKDGDTLPDDLVERIATFDPKAFDLEGSCRALGELTREHKRAVLEMLSALSESDDGIDLAEDEFLRKVADALGATPEELAGLTVEIEIAPRRPAPPPLPKK